MDNTGKRIPNTFKGKIRWIIEYFVPKRVARIYKRIVSKKFTYLETHLVHHCNLNCVGCSHFSPLVDEKWFADIDSYEKDIERISEFSFPLKVIKLMGGEPLLHPEIISFFEVTRRHLKETKIILVTNGILLSSKEDKFWRACHDNGVSIEISGYPIDLDVKKINHLASKYSVDLFYKKVQGEMRARYLEPEPKFSARRNFNKCCMANCTTLLEGKLYPCSLGTYINFFNESSNTHFPEEKGLDLHRKNLSKEQILNYINSPIELCKYCVTTSIPSTKWRKSSLEIEEWVS